MLLIHAATTWFMVGLIWVIQVVHYPLFDAVGAEGFAEYEREHARRMGRVLAVPATTEVVTGAGLLWWRPSEVGLGLVVGSGALLALIWVVTVSVQVPLHARLSMGFDAAAHRRLVATNWVRTAAWTARGVLVALMLAV